MRTDVKVGLICAFAIVLGVVIYFVAQSNNSPARAKADSTLPLPTITHDTPKPSDPLPAGAISTPSVAPVPTPAASPVATVDRTLAAGPVGGPSIIPPAPGAGAPTTPPTTPAATPSMGPTPATPSFTPTPNNDSLIPAPPKPTLEFSTPGGMTPPTPFTPMAPSTAGTTYKIQKGDMLGTIAKKYGVTVKALEAANPGINSNNLKIDTPIKIPTAAPATTRPAATRPTARGTTPTTPTTPTVTSTSLKAGTTYKVKKGDTLTTIAKAAYGSGTHATIEKIVQANHIPDPNVVAIGTEIKLP